MVVFLFLILALIATTLSNPSLEYSYRFTSIKCSGSSMNTTKYHFCFVKAYSRTVSTLNFGITLNRDLNKIYVKFSADYKYGAVFQNILNLPVFEWCSYINGNPNNILVNKMIDLVKDSVPEFFHKCPYKVIVIVNINFKKSCENVHHFRMMFTFTT